MEGHNRTGGVEKEDSRGHTPTEASNWEMLVELLQTAFREGQLSEEATWQEVVLITKG